MESSLIHTRAVISHVHEYISGKGFFYTKQDIVNLFLSLQTKPFVILAGISGTGKSQLPRLFAEAMGFGENCYLLPVRPDWTDSSDLLGFTDLHGVFQPGILSQIIAAAHQKPEEVFMVILDEMNLARVEHYFSEYLSILETRRKVDGRVLTDPLPHEAAGIPDNLMLVGTVNMDETTHPFSRKVLDRANAIEMNDIYLDWPPESEAVEAMERVSSDIMRSRFVHARDVNKIEQERVRSSLHLMMELNDILAGANLQFGYRIRDEIAFFMLNRYEIRELLSEQEAMDIQICQKILPRIHGSSARIGQLLRELIIYFLPAQSELANRFSHQVMIEHLAQLSMGQIRFPKSLQKLSLMYQRLEEDGYTSFWM
ncbi:MAG: AAA family ATPase [Bacteroidota bacterium]